MLIGVVGLSDNGTEKQSTVPVQQEVEKHF